MTGHHGRVGKMVCKKCGNWYLRQDGTKGCRITKRRTGPAKTCKFPGDFITVEDYKTRWKEERRNGKKKVKEPIKTGAKVKSVSEPETSVRQIKPSTGKEPVPGSGGDSTKPEGAKVPAGKCHGITQANKPCKKKAVKDGFCRIHGEK